MLQEVRNESLPAILESSWVQRNFILTDVDAPKSIDRDIPGESFVLKDPYWEAAPYFTIMMTPKSLGGVNCFRVPFTSRMGRDALCVDIPISASDGCTRSNDLLRLCTTHLESLYDEGGYRPDQLATILTLLKQPQASGRNIIAGLVGGDMNANDRSEHELHRASDVDLSDVWEDVPAPPSPVLKPFQKDPSFGRAKGNTWGYQSEKARNRKRLDKFFYTGRVETVALKKSQDVTGKLGRVGIGVRTEVEAWESDVIQWKILRGKVVKKPCKVYYSHRIAGSSLEGPDKGSLSRTRITTWVGDHFGIAVGIKVV